MNLEFKALLELGEQRCCPTCGRWAQVYRRRIYGTVAMQLIRLYKLGGTDDYVHTRNLLGRGATGVGDFSKAKYWGLIEEAPNIDNNKNNNGLWRLTGIGISFVCGVHRIQEYALVYNDAVLKFDGKPVSIEDCLGKKFDYRELMGN